MEARSSTQRTDRRAADAVGLFQLRLAGLEGAVELGLDAVAILRLDEGRAQVGRFTKVGRQPEEGLALGGPDAGAGLQVDIEDADPAGPLGQQQALLVFPKLRFGPLALGDIAGDMAPSRSSGSGRPAAGWW